MIPECAMARRGFTAIVTLLRRLHKAESGQVTILFVFASIGFVIMFGFILNTAQQTGNKIKMQGAADSAAVAGATWVARGMNLIVFDNKGMADILGAMIDIHAAYQASIPMPAPVIPSVAIPLAFVAPELSAEMMGEIPVWTARIEALANLDNDLSGPSGLGWRLMDALDQLNEAIAGAAPLIAGADALAYANRNGLPGTIGAILPGPLPLARGGRGRLALQANSCCLGGLEKVTFGTFELTGTPVTGFLFYPLFLLAVQENVASLSGGNSPGSYQYTAAELADAEDSNGQTLQDIINNYNNQQLQKNPKSQPVTVSQIFQNNPGATLGLGPLGWPGDMPQPMVLTDTGNPTDELGDPPPVPNFLTVRQRLQYLSGARAPQNSYGLMGGAKFANTAPYGWITYAEGDVYNPINWDMFDQHWRARLARASNLNAWWTSLTGAIGAKLSGTLDSSFVNTH